MHAYASCKVVFAVHELTCKKSTQLHDAFISRVRQRHDLNGCSETGTVGARSVRAP